MSAIGCGQSEFRERLELDESDRIIDHDDGARHLAGLGGEGCVAGIEVVVLRLEVVAAMEHHPITLEFLDEDQPGERIPLVDELLDREVVLQLEPAPPLGLLLASMPVEEIGEQPASFSIGRMVVRREAGGQSGDPFLDGLEPVGQGRRWRLRLRERALPGQVGPAPDGLRTPLLQPPAKEPGRDAVVAVIGSDPVEDGLVSFLEPRLERDDAEPGVGHRPFAGRHVELLDLLERVRLDRRTDALANDVEQVDEDIAAEEPVDFVDAGPVSLHQPLDGPRLVAAVVVDMHLRVPVETIHEEPDEALEGGLLRRLRGRPDVEVARRPVDLLDHAEEVLEPDFGGPRVGLDIEEEVPRRRLRKGAEAPSRVGRIGRDQLEDGRSGVAFLELESRLFAHSRQLGAGDALDHAVGFEHGELLKRRDPRSDQPFGVEPPDPSHDREVIVSATAIDAHRVPGADPAVVHRVRIGTGGAVRQSRRDPGVEAGADVSEIGREVVRTVRMLDAVAGDDVEPLGRDPLEPLEQVRVDAHLEDRATLDRAGQLGIRDVIAPVAEHRARAVRALEQEVRVAPPATVEEGRLEDDVGAGTHRIEGGRLS